MKVSVRRLLAAASLALPASIAPACGSSTDVPDACNGVVGDCPAGSSPVFGASADAACSGQASGSYITQSGKVSGQCKSSGGCSLYCEFKNPCACGVNTLSKDVVQCLPEPCGCGNGVCESGEAASCAGAMGPCRVCPQDCDVPCGNGVCEKGETPQKCPKDCSSVPCGNGICEAGESPTTCPTDCGCIPGEKRCVGGMVEFCPVDGKAPQTVACSVGKICVNGDCVAGTSQCPNGLREGSEECDGSDLGGTTCDKIPGKDNGVLSCTAACKLDASKCCTNVCFPKGSTRCTTAGVQTCEQAASKCLDWGAASKCASGACNVNGVDCQPLTTCNNGKQDAGEECDGAQLFTTCKQKGYDGGTPSCTGSCTLNTAGCCKNDSLCSKAGPYCSGAALVTCSAAASGCLVATSTTCPQGCSGTACTNDPCAGNSCNGHGVCAGGNCTCSSNYSGLLCDQCAPGRVNYPICSVADPCASIDCNGHGSCGSGLCNCNQGYQGTLCDQCASGYTGYPNCAVDLCAGVSCSGHGTCSGGSCSCNSGFAGSNCSSCAPGFGGPNCALCGGKTTVAGPTGGSANTMCTCPSSGTSSCHSLYTGTVQGAPTVGPNGPQATVRFAKFDGSSWSAATDYKVAVVAQGATLTCNQLFAYTARKTGNISSGATSQTVTFDIWSSKGEFDAASVGDTKCFVFVTGSNTWWQPQPVCFTKSCG